MARVKYTGEAKEFKTFWNGEYVIIPKDSFIDVPNDWEDYYKQSRYVKTEKVLEFEKKKVKKDGSND